jgi:membrane associated rhomboid family serine protease
VESICAMTYQEKEYKRRLSLGQKSNSLITLISVNVILFIILAFVRSLFLLKYETTKVATVHFNDSILNWFTLPAAARGIAQKPWVILIHMFTDIDTWRVLGNMLWLWMFGYILQDLTGNRKIFPVYMYASFAGALAFVLALNFIPALQVYQPNFTLFGASAGIMGIAIAATTLAPGYRIFPMLNGGIPVWVITTIYVLIDLLTLRTNNPGWFIAHVAGAVTGFLFIYFYRKGYDWGGWMNNLYDWFNDLFNPEKPKKGKNIKKELFYKSDSKPYHKTPNVTSQRVDEILDKINQHGYNSLTDEEKELLKKASQEDF